MTSDKALTEQQYDVVIIGSGFGGSVAALRLTEKGYKVLVLEAGRRFKDEDFPKTSWNIRSFLWAPLLGCFGIQNISVLKNVMILSGAGVGGGSLVYANTLYTPPQAFYDDPQWKHITDWKTELEPYYKLAQRMLGVVRNPTHTPSDEVMLNLAKEMGIEKTFQRTPVGVYFGKPGEEVADPYFGGAGPARKGCIECGSCMTGCRHNAKNTLVKNYLYLAEQSGLRISDLTTAMAVRPVEDGSYAIDTKSTGSILQTKKKQTFIARDVIFAAGTLGTQKLLHRMRDLGYLPEISQRLGSLSRTNSEAILGARTFSKKVDFSKGVAITSSVHPNAHTHFEPVRYGKGSNFMGVLGTALVDGDRFRFFSWMKEIMKNPLKSVRNVYLRKWSEQSVIVLVMQTLNNSITCYSKKGLFGWTLTSKQGEGNPNPTWIPAGHEAVRKIARQINGVPNGGWNDVFNIPMTAHFIGGVTIGESPETGVIDPYHRIYGYPQLHVVDGAAISANLGVNPSLTITAQAERAMAFWPNKGQIDSRAPQNQPYKKIEPIGPCNPVLMHEFQS
jgi:cholesterol oxidase